MKRTECTLGTVVCLRGHDIALTISDGFGPEELEQAKGTEGDGTDIVEVSWFNSHGEFSSQRLECGILVPWPDCPQAMKRIGVDSSSSDGGFEVDNRGAPEQDAPAKAPQRPWTSDPPSDRGD